MINIREICKLLMLNINQKAKWSSPIKTVSGTCEGDTVVIPVCLRVAYLLYVLY